MLRTAVAITTLLAGALMAGCSSDDTGGGSAKGAGDLSGKLGDLCGGDTIVPDASSVLSTYGSQYSFESAEYDDEQLRCELDMGFDSPSTPLSYTVETVPSTSSGDVEVEGFLCSYQQSETADSMECPVSDTVELTTVFGFYQTRSTTAPWPTGCQILTGSFS